MADWWWPVLGLAIVLVLLVLGARITRYKHEAMVLVALGEVHRARGDAAKARLFYEAARGGSLKVPEADAGLEALAAGDRLPVLDHPLVDDVERRLDEERDELDAWLRDRGFPRLGTEA